jgi:butyryl-CoA dehydrogenase
MRAVAYVTASAFDHAHRDPDAAARKHHQAFVDLMIPIVKGWSTETSQEVASLGVQVHGGMGYIEETGAAQYLRDARITTIYEGTTGIQANDLIGRKTMRDGGATARDVATEIDRVAARLASSTVAELRGVGLRLATAATALRTSVEWVVNNSGDKTRLVHAAAVPYLKLWGLVVGGWQMGRAALAAAERIERSDGDLGFLRAKLVTARYYAESILPQAEGLALTITEGSSAALALAAEEF